MDIDDLNHVRNNFGGTGPGDANGDGIVNIDDLNAVRNHFGTAAAAPRIPTPSTRGCVWNRNWGVQVRTVRPHSGFLGSDEPVVHFGLGADERIDRLQITWPNGDVQKLANLPVDHRFVISQPESNSAESEPGDEPMKAPAMFHSSDVLAGAVHKELPYDDFVHQPLLPNKYSQLGPGVACGDVDGDGDEDLYVGGAAQQPGRLWLNDGGQSFAAARVADFVADQAAEDMASVFFDADGDGDLDLYVVSGSYEFRAGHSALADRLYVNDGAGQFEKTTAGALPELRDCGSTVTACDFDRDGDLGLFVGGRLIPRQYPLIPESRLLRNATARGGRFGGVVRLVEWHRQFSTGGRKRGRLPE